MSEPIVSRPHVSAGWHLLPLALATVLPTMTLLHPTESLAAQPERAPEIIAAQLRRQGVVCTTPRDAARDHGLSAAHKTVWMLVCDEAAYRVELTPRMGARISPVLD